MYADETATLETIGGLLYIGGGRTAVPCADVVTEIGSVGTPGTPGADLGSTASEGFAASSSEGCWEEAPLLSQSVAQIETPPRQCLSARSSPRERAFSS
jgi:hypothetical protein